MQEVGKCPIIEFLFAKNISCLSRRMFAWLKPNTFLKAKLNRKRLASKVLLSRIFLAPLQFFKSDHCQRILSDNTFQAGLMKPCARISTSSPSFTHAKREWLCHTHFLLQSYLHCLSKKWLKFAGKIFRPKHDNRYCIAIHVKWIRHSRIARQDKKRRNNNNSFTGNSSLWWQLCQSHIKSYIL